jgi:hypothetical protein
MRHAYLIIAHRNWNILNFLIQALDENEVDFFLLLDKKVHKPISELIYIQPEKSKLIELPRIQINWGGIAKFVQNSLC